MEKHSRTLAKTLTWRIFGTLITIGVVYLFEKDLKNSIFIGIVANLIKMFFYYIHERIWNKASFGREIIKQAHHTILNSPVRIKKAQFEKMVENCKQEKPREACGILAGKEGLITKVYRMRNISKKPAICYFMEGKEQLKVAKEIRNAGLVMLGIYHSHVSSTPYPSARDVEMAFYPEVSQFIVSLADKKTFHVRSFKIKQGEIEEEKIECMKEE